MNLNVVISGRSYGVDLSQPKCLAIPLDFTGSQPRFFDARRAASIPLKNQDFVGATPDGGSCNVSEIYLTPHCNGTHTESVGHVVHQPRPVCDALDQSLVPATLITVEPMAAAVCGESYRPDPKASDTLITRTQLEGLLGDKPDEEMRALAIRVNPNDSAKKSRDYGEGPVPPYFSVEAMCYVAERGIRHLLVDVPSVDRMQDEGRLTNHHIFWDLAEGSHDLALAGQADKTITEMIYVDDSIPDGLYLLNLQVPAFVSDAAPSRPVLYPLSETS